jgi:CRISPR-associated exonuclease Cas4
MGRGGQEPDPLPLSGLQHLVFCPRQAALIHLEGAWSENLHTAQGRIEHKAVHAESSRIKDGVLVARGLWLRSRRLGLIGRADVVEFHCLGSRGGPPGGDEGCRLPGPSGRAGGSRAGRWQPFPVEHKKGRKRPEPGSLVQLCAQGLCLEEMLEVDVPRGALYFGRSKRRLGVVFDPELRARTERAARDFHRLLEVGRTPPPREKGKCGDCSLLDQCQPRASRDPKPVAGYLASALAASLKAEVEDG